LPLDHLAASAALVLDDIPVAMLFAVFETSVESQEHANQPTPSGLVEKRWQVYTTADLREAALESTRVFGAGDRKNCCSTAPIG
jgi:hypothetical protein